MSKLGIIIKREYLRRVSKKSFILLTLLTPLLFAALVFVPLWLSSIKGDEVKTVMIVDSTGKYANLFTNTDHFHFVNSTKSLEEYRKNPDKEVFAILNITDDLLQSPKAATLYSEKQVPGELSRLVNQTIGRELENEKMASFNIPNLKEIIAESKISFNVQTIKWSEDGKETASSAVVASAIGMIFTIIIYMFIMIYGGMVMQGVMEEKTNRIIEVIISSVRPFDLMLGKIIGIGFVGLTQLFFWGIIGSVIMTLASFFLIGNIDTEALQQGAAMMNSPIDMDSVMAQQGVEFLGIINGINFYEIGVLFIVYFIGGYLLYASVFAAIGSAVEQQEDTQQFMIPITILLVFALYAGIYSMENPDGPLAFWCSLIPFSSSIVMMVRLPFDVPLWEKLLSIVLLYSTSIGMVWLSAKIYRVGILMYGKKPSIKEIVKWIKYK